MAAGLINARLGDDFFAVSAGTKPSGYVHPKAIAAMAEIGIDISEGRSKSANEFYGQYFDYVITVCDDAKEDCPLWLANAGAKTHIGFIDPADAIGTEEEITAVFRNVRDQIANRVLTYLLMAL